MLTFHFTGVDGSMTEYETLTSGMVGKQIQLLFDESWDNLNKTVVFRAGETCRVVLEAEPVITIPDEVLARPFGKLYVGIYGTDGSGSLVIPTIMAEGPLIRYGADPVEDETAKELPVWENLQNQIGDLTTLNTIQKSDLVGAVNELHSQVNFIATDCVGLSVDAARLLVQILRQGQYHSDQTANIDTLARMLGDAVAEDLSHLIHYWDFRTGSLTDRIGGLEAVASEDVTLDKAGAHISSNASYIMFPAGLDGASLAGNTVEVKFGTVNLSDTASTMRLVAVCNGTQPASVGLQWSVQDCWAGKATELTEFTDLNMFSDKSLIGKASADASRIDWYFEDQLITSSVPGFVHTHLSIGSSVNGAFPLTVEYVRIYPTI